MLQKGDTSYVESKADMSVLKATYVLHESVVGAGKFGKVFIASDKQNPKFKVAIKMIQTKSLT